MKLRVLYNHKTKNIMNISFFITKNNGSGICRGEQISNNILGSRVFLKEDINIDLLNTTICIWVKFLKGDDKILNNIDISKNFFIDIVDGTKGIKFARKNSQVGVIASSRSSYEYMRKALDRDDVILIPHHHCNFENSVIPDRPIEKVGFIGCDPQNMFDEEFEKLLKNVGLHFVSLINPKTRESVVSFLQSIDIQIAATFGISLEKRYLKNSLKISNGGSFRIPTVATPEISYKSDYDECFITAYDTESIIKSCELLKNNKSLYKTIAEKSFKRSKDYHIDRIVELYEKTKNI